MTLWSKTKQKQTKNTTVPNLFTFSFRHITLSLSFIVPNAQHPKIHKEEYPISQVFSAKPRICRIRQNNYSRSLNYICMYVYINAHIFAQ